MIQSDYWYKNATVYGVDVKTFMDADGDGVGDIQGLIRRLDYLDRLGIDCIWMLPFYPTPDRDNGYDVADYYGVNSEYGTLGDFVELVREADSRGIRVLIDLVVNHTSDRHPWFQKARRGEQPYRDYYVWSEDPPEPDAEPIFPEAEDSVWSYDEEADAYYYHRFFDFEPGLNLSNPDVRREIKQIMGFWMELGVSGFRFDAATVMISKKGLESTEMERPHDVLKEFREFVDRRSQDALLLGEAGGSPERVERFYGEGDEMNMVYNFLLAGYLFHSLATEDAATLEDGIRNLPPVPESGQWGNFLRNHDELNLEWLTDEQREEVFDAFAPDEEMRIFDRGIRRRLAPMLDGDERRLKMAFSLLFSLPGSPILYYGEEIGMGEDLSLSGREAVRTPMQWSDEENAGFSPAPAEDLAMPVIDQDPYGYERINVDDQQFREGSLLGFVERLTRTRDQHPEIGWGDLEILDTGADSVFAHRCVWEDRSTVALHNLGDERRTVSLELRDDEPVRLVNLLGDREYGLDGDGTVEFELDPFGCRWLRIGDVQDSARRPDVRKSTD